MSIYSVSVFLFLHDFCFALFGFLIYFSRKNVILPSCSRIGPGSMLRLIYAYSHRHKDTNSHVTANKIICDTNAFTNNTAIVLDVY